MRPHRLEITAFGPFADTEVVDFDALTSAGLFLVHGPTGSGKTSVLDAVCFALYGSVPGERNAAKSLRSDHAPPGRAPRVVLEVTIRGRRLRISRSPAWERPRKRGSGVTTEHAKATVEERDGDRWIPRSARVDEASHFIAGLLGMSASQFCQVALLPQGRFAEFLRAEAAQRRKVLERLFAAEIFADVEEWLGEHRAAAGRQAAELRAAADSVADRIAEIAGTVRPECELMAWATELSGHMAAIAEQARAHTAQARTRLENARAAAGQGRELAERQRRQADALRRRATLDGRERERAAAVQKLAAGVRAERVLPLVKTVSQRARAVAGADSQAVSSRAALEDLVADGADLEVLVKEERGRRDESAGLEQLRGDAIRLRELRDEIAGAEADIARLEGDAAEGRDLLDSLPGRIVGLRRDLSEARERAASRPAALARLDSLHVRLGAARRRDELSVSLEKAERRHRDVVDVAQEARESLQRIRQERLDGMAVRLAQGLKPGMPCPVCGSADHPHLATATADLPSDAAEEDAEAAYEDARRDREETAARVASLRAELAAETATAGGGEAGDLAEQCEAAQRGFDALSGAVATAGRLETELADLEATLDAARDRRAEVADLLTAARTHRTGLLGAAGRLTERIDAARGDDPDLDARIARLLQEADLIGEAVRAIEAARQAAAELAAARTAAVDAARHQGFGSLEAVRDAEVPGPIADGLRAMTRMLDDEEAAVKELLSDPQLAAAAECPAPDLTALQTALADADEEAVRTSAASDRARRRQDRITELRGDLAARLADWRPAARRHELAVGVAELARGTSPDNRWHMRLSAYVLAARLAQVVAAANERLGRMAGGRYALLHTRDRVAGDSSRSGGGLGLRVADAWTGQERDPATLSGGETFLVSLALTLGLADVVTVEAGGTEIGTLFVDEGFGALDDDALDEVMDVLDDLREGGRSVGIVSHVGELRTRINARLRVHRNRTGSCLSVNI